MLVITNLNQDIMLFIVNSFTLAGDVWTAVKSILCLQCRKASWKRQRSRFIKTDKR